MTHGTTLAVDLAPDLAASLQEAVAAGDYASPAEIVSEALQSWSTERAMANPDADRIRVLWDAGLRSGPGTHLTIDEIKREARSINR